MKKWVLIFLAATSFQTYSSQLCKTSLSSETTLPVSEQSIVKVNIPKRTSEEQKLKLEGFPAAYRRGMDEMNEWIAIHEQLIKAKANPYSTYVDYFAAKMKENIEYFEEGVMSLSQKRKFDRLKKYAEPLIERQEVNYYRFLRFHLSLSKVLDEEMLSDAYEDAYDIIRFQMTENFPDYIAMPTTIGAVGIIPMNKGSARGIHPLGLKRGNGSVGFFAHDALHYIAGRSQSLNAVYDRITEHSKGLPIEKRRNIELSYWVLTHEHQRLMQNPEQVLSEEAQERVKHTVTPTNPEMKGLIDLSHEPNKKAQTLINDFLEIYSQIQ